MNGVGYRAPCKLDETLEDYSRQIHRLTLAAFFLPLLRIPSKLSNFVVDVFDNGILQSAKVGPRTAGKRLLRVYTFANTFDK